MNQKQSEVSFWVEFYNWCLAVRTSPHVYSINSSVWLHPSGPLVFCFGSQYFESGHKFTVHTLSFKASTINNSDIKLISPHGLTAAQPLKLLLFKVYLKFIYSVFLMGSPWFLFLFYEMLYSGKLKNIYTHIYGTLIYIFCIVVL